jgi:hypothetical protein
MSFAYKTLKGSDISISPYIANKQYTFPSNSLSSSGIIVYTGEYDPQYIISGTVYNAFDPINDIKNNGYYRRFIFDSIQKLYYQNYISGSQSGSFFVSSSYENYNQTTLVSGAFDATVVKVLNINTASATQPKIRVISIPQNIYGNGVQPGTFIISSSTYYIKDDGQGNLWDYIISGSIYNQDPYSGSWYAGTNNTKIYVGNIVYSPGFAIIVNPDYLCFYPSDPVALNDNYTILNVSESKVLDILVNDFDDCSNIDDATVMTYPLTGYSFPSFSIVSGDIHITDCGANNLQVTPGVYKILYTVNNDKGAISNLATCSLTILSDKFTSSFVAYTSGCWGDVASQSVTFSLDLGIPPYSYSLDNVTYTGFSGCALYQPIVSLYVPTNDNVNVYLKDVAGTILSYSLDTQLFPIVPNSSYLDTCLNQSTGWISASATGGNPTNALSASIQSGSYNSGYFPLVGGSYVFTGLNSGSYTVTWKDNNNCTTSSTEVITTPSPINISLQSVEADCPGGTGQPNGGIAVSVTGGSGLYNYRWTTNSGVSFVSYVEDPVGLSAGNYELYVSDSTGCNDSTSSVITVGSVTAVGFAGFTIASSSCFGSGGGGSITGGSLTGGSGSLNPVFTGPNGFTSNSVNIINLNTGSYTLTVTDSATGCYYTFGPYAVNEPTEFKSSSFTIDRVIGNGPYRTRFAFQGGTLDTSGGYTASIFLSSSAGLSLQYTVTASTTAIQQLLLTQSCLTASTNWVLEGIDDNGCASTNNNPGYYLSLDPQVVQQVPVCFSANTSSNVCGCDPASGSFTIFYLSSSYSTSSNDILQVADLNTTGGINGDINALVWANCAQTTTASVGTYWDSGDQQAIIGLGTGVGGFVNALDDCPVGLLKQITTFINNNPIKVTSQTQLQYQYGAAVTSSNFFLSWTGTTSSFDISGIPVPPGVGSYVVSASLNQDVDPQGNIIVAIYVTSGSSTGYESPAYYLVGPATYVGVMEASFISSPLFITGNLNYIVNIDYSSTYYQ